MPSPFPGMDPFLERQEWEDFHTTFNTVVREVLAPSLGTDYLIRVERRVYVEHVGEEPLTMRRADVAIISRDSGLASGLKSSVSGNVVSLECELPMPAERRETYLIIRDRATSQVVTVIELLSPANKRLGGDGRKEYLAKREEILCSQSHLVEIDLLRGGERLPVVGLWPAGDYFAIISRVHQRPRGEIFAWTIHRPLPTIPIPLKRGDDDVPLNLQSVFSTVFERARYDLSVDYKQPLDPPLDPDTAYANIPC